MSVTSKESPSPVVSESPEDGGLKSHAEIPEEICIDPEEERRLVRKIDFRVMPLLFLMYFFNSLDRNNLGAAKTDGIDKDLNFTKYQYNILVSVFYIPYCALTVPANMLTRKLSARWTLPSYLVFWGCTVILSPACKNFGGLATLRILLGVAEAGFGVGGVFYLTQFYKRDELAKRIALFYGSQTVSGAFSGLIAFGLFQVKGKLHGWQYLYLVEGALTITIGLVALAFLPQPPHAAKFLNEREREICRLRSLRDASQAVGVKLQLRDFFAPLKDWKLWAWSFIAFCFGVTNASVGNFTPLIVAKLGYSTVKTNLYTVAPYLVSAILLFAMATSSDYFRERTYHLVSAFTMSCVGFIIIASIDVESHIGVAYFAVFLIVGGCFTPSILFHSWHQNNVLSEDRRAFNIAFITFLCNAAGLVASNVFTPDSAPKYIPALVTNYAFLAAAIVVTLAMRFWMKRQNTLRNKEQGVNWTSADVPTHLLRADVSENPHENVHFRFFL
ncbi:MFS general substrate transporter [Pleurostoma richardsiae]|uniref:MFS general substrate transporter n=1 Tax=Pleurostoma richardsiae TaxID=41990 RepID=A0AA38RSD3_9PEZI|nr:MFS general substrate transporter [Pleurostoma richardsiae]